MTMQTKLSAKGQVVIPKDVRDRLGLTEGMVFDVIERGSEVVLKRQARIGDPSGAEAVANAVREIRSFYRYDGPPVSLDDMDRAVHAAVGKKFSRKSTR
jgi:AbrB family looped-hinge helix DNA binding protein